MHCRCCDKLLTDIESTRKHKETGEYLDICNVCLKEIQEIIKIPYTTGKKDETFYRHEAL